MVQVSMLPSHPGRTVALPVGGRPSTAGYAPARVPSKLVVAEWNIPHLLTSTQATVIKDEDAHR